jgi:transposase
MESLIMTGCDVHDKTLLLMTAEGTSQPLKRTVQNSAKGRAAMIAELQKRGAESKARLIFAYEASALGFGLYDELTAAGIECVVLAPGKIARSAKQLRNKTDEKDAAHILELLRGHYLAGNKLPSIWIPDKLTRDDRELLRARLNVQEKRSKVKTQIRTLLKRHGLVKLEDAGVWTLRYKVWLKGLLKGAALPGPGTRNALGSLLRQLSALDKEIHTLDAEIAKLAKSTRYQAGVAELCKLEGVGVLVSMVFLTEMGNLHRFANRRQLSAFLGLVPSSKESGEAGDRKGRITHQGPARVRQVLCQAAWNRVRFDSHEARIYQRIAAKNPKHKKIAVVASMRRLAIRMWHGAKAHSPLRQTG